jgi:hypothetical protein
VDECGQGQQQWEHQNELQILVAEIKPSAALKSVDAFLAASWRVEAAVRE